MGWGGVSAEGNSSVVLVRKELKKPLASEKVAAAVVAEAEPSGGQGKRWQVSRHNDLNLLV